MAEAERSEPRELLVGIGVRVTETQLRWLRYSAATSGSGYSVSQVIRDLVDVAMVRFPLDLEGQP